MVVTAFDWDDLRYFLEVARLGTLSGAARALRIDHATVGRRVSALERALGQTLFDRSLVGYALKPAGEQLLIHAEQMEALALRSAGGLGPPGAALAGLVRLTTPDGFGNFFLAERLEMFVSAYPKLSLQLVPLQQIQAQSQRECDVAVTLTRSGARFVTEWLADYGLGLYATDGYLAAHPQIVVPDDLRSHRMVGYVEDLLVSSELDYLDDVLPGVHANVQCSSLLAQLAATRGGAGICVLPNFVTRAFPELIGVLPDQIQLRRSYWLNIAPAAVKVPRVRAFMDFLRETAAAFDFQ